MKRQTAEIHLLSDRIAVCQTYDPKVKAELFATLVEIPAGAFLIDGFAVDDETIAQFIGGRTITGLIVTNENHARASGDLSRLLKAPIYADPAAAIVAARDICDLPAALRIVRIAGAAKGEVALFSQENGGTIIVGDALINFGSNGFALLPPKYCIDPKLMRKSLRQLLDFEFARILFAHGSPILTNARNRLAALLEDER